MSIEFDQINVEMNNIDDALIEKVWHDLDGQMSREQVRRVVANVALGFQNAKVKAFLPILIHREALEQLQKWLEARSLEDGRFPTDDQQQPDNQPTAHAIINS